VSKRRKEEKHVIGWRECIALPELGISHVKAKIDTGARSSALHAFEIVLFKKGGRRMVRKLAPPAGLVAGLELLGLGEQAQVETRARVRVQVLEGRTELRQPLQLEQQVDVGAVLLHAEGPARSLLRHVLLPHQAHQRRGLVEVRDHDLRPDSLTATAIDNGQTGRVSVLVD